MAPLVVPGVARFTIHGNYLGGNVANVLDMHLDVGGLTSRSDACLDQAKVIVSAWRDHILGQLQQLYNATSCSWVDMNSTVGSTGETIDGTGSDFPFHGGDTSDSTAAMVSYLVKKNITAGRGARQGRMFLCGVGETATVAGDGNTVGAAKATAFAAALPDFLSAINQESGVSGAIYDSDLVVVHTTNTGTTEDPVIEFVSTSHVNSLTLDPKVHAQRRRMS